MLGLLSLLTSAFIFSAETNDLTSITPDELFEIIRTIDIFALFALPEFWHLSLAFSRWSLSFSQLLSVYVLSSVLLFGTGLYLIHHFIKPLSAELVSLLALLMGVTHLVIAKLLLNMTSHEELIGPFLGSGVFGMLYFSLIGFGSSLSAIRFTDEAK